MAEKNLVELGLVADICCRWTQIGVMAADMWWRIWTRIGGGYMVVVYGSGGGSGGSIWIWIGGDIWQRRRDNLRTELETLKD